MSPTSSPLHTPLCDLLGIRYPIIQAPMAGGWTTPSWSQKSPTLPAYQERLLMATETDTVVTRAFSGRPARSIRNRFGKEHLKADLEPLYWPLQSIAAGDVYREAMSRGEADLVPLFAGQGLRMLDRVKSAAEIVWELMEEAGEVLSITVAGRLNWPNKLSLPRASWSAFKTCSYQIRDGWLPYCTAALALKDASDGSPFGSNSPTY